VRVFFSKWEGSPHQPWDTIRLAYGVYKIPAAAQRNDEEALVGQHNLPATLAKKKGGLF
jgi:hypothetical protein